MGEGCNGCQKRGGLRGPRRLGHFGAGMNCRCPRGEQCGKNYKLLYKKNSSDEAAEAGAWHLFDKDKHPDHGTWEECRTEAECGVSESTRTYWVFLDTEGVERQPPSVEKGDKKGKGHGKGGKGKGGGERDRRSERRNGSRSRTPQRREPRQPSHSPRRRSSDGGVQINGTLRAMVAAPIGSAPPPMAMPVAVPGSASVVITRSELVMVVDSLARAIASCDHCAVFMANAERHFRAESCAIEASKRAAERFLRL